MFTNKYFSSNSTHSITPFRRMFDKTEFSDYDEFYSTFKWKIPLSFNIGYECSDYHVSVGNGNKTALIDHTSGTSYSFNDISSLSNKLCNSFRNKLNIIPGDRISILLPQSYETGITHLSTFKLGAISLPLFILFGIDELLFRLHDSETKCIVTNKDCLQKILSLKPKLPHLEYIIVTGKDVTDCNDYLSFESLICDSSSHFTSVSTSCDDPAVIIYTSGTTGNPKGCLHAHRVLLGHLPGIETPHNFLPKETDVFWTPADWAWIGGLFDALLPSWYYGIPIIAYRPQKFDVADAFDLMKTYNVTCTFLPPTALKMMKMIYEQHVADKGDDDKLKHKLRSVGSGGESLGDALHEWALNVFQTEINEFYGQTECNLVVSNAQNVFKSRARSMGKIVPGHIVEIMDNDGNILDNNCVGNICIQYPDPVMFLNYWNNPDKTAEKFMQNNNTNNIKWMITGDLGYRDDDGYLFYDSRDDDIINSGGYRIGPTAIEVASMKHKYVLNCAAVASPDNSGLRNEVVKVFIVLKDNCNITNDNNEGNLIKKEIQNIVRNSVGHHAYPRYIEFINELPMTITGKIQRKILKKREYDNYQNNININNEI